MAFQAKDGKKFTNRAPMMSHERSMARHGGAGMMERTDPLKQPGDGGEDMDMNDKPMNTEHHPDGSHTTHHESGMAHDSENLEGLKSHLDKFLTEEEHEGGEGQDEPEYD
jgi:hypothetical protein